MIGTTSQPRAAAPAYSTYTTAAPQVTYAAPQATHAGMVATPQVTYVKTVAAPQATYAAATTKAKATTFKAASSAMPTSYAAPTYTTVAPSYRVAAPQTLAAAPVIVQKVPQQQLTPQKVAQQKAGYAPQVQPTPLPVRKVVAKKEDGGSSPASGASGDFSPTDRATYKVTAATDFVKDYRELAGMPIWNDVLANVPDNFTALDVCCGTGRWARAFCDLVCAPRGIVVQEDFVDLCHNSLSVLEKTADEMPAIKMGRLHALDIGRRGANDLEPASYGLVVNMHGLYGVPPSMIPVAMTFMSNMLCQGGRLVVALGSEDSLYQKIPTMLHEAGIIEDRFTSVAQVVDACHHLGLDVEVNSLLYYEEYDADDKKSVNRFVMDECVGNTFDVDGTPKFSEEQCWETLRPMLDTYLDVKDNRYKFKQDISIITLHKKALVPDMLSCDSFYDDAYVLRRKASTMQSSTIEFLRSRGQDIAWGALPSPSSKRLSMLTIGCGDGELDFALLDSKADRTTSVDIIALEPNQVSRDAFLKELPNQGWYGRQAGQGDVTVSMKSDIFKPSSQYLSEGGELHDVLVLAHVLYYFEDKSEALRGVLRQVKRGGTAIIIHQGAEGVPEIQEKMLPKLRGHCDDMFTAAQIQQLLEGDLASEVAEFKNHKIDAFMNTAEIMKGTEDGLKIMSFAIEADMRAANQAQIAEVRREFEQRSVSGPVPGHVGVGSYMNEPVHCFIIKRA